MPKSADQKLKLIKLLHFFMENTDEAHPASMQSIIDYLGSQGIKAERKSIYTDIDALRQLEYDIVNRKETPAGYYMASRDFELAELKLLVDAVQSSKFITEKKSNALISKIEKLTSHYEGHRLQRQVYVAKRVKTDNEAILYNIDYIHEAISGKNQIEFCYSEWSLDKKLVLRNNGEKYNTDPLMLVWDDENYYLVAYDNKDNIIKHFRVDKMSSIDVLKTKCDNKYSDNFNSAEYTKEHFGMFSGEEDTVMVSFPNKLIGVVIDRFGRDVTIIRNNNDTFTARLRIQVSDQFFGWISGFRGKAVIEAPDEVKKEFIKFIDDIRNSV